MTVDDLANGLLSIVRIGAITRFVFCMVKLIGADEESGRYRKRAMNIFLFWVLAECMWLLRDLVFQYFS